MFCPKYSKSLSLKTKKDFQKRISKRPSEGDVLCSFQSEPNLFFFRQERLIKVYFSFLRPLEKLS